MLAYFKKIVVGSTNNAVLKVQSIYHFLIINGYNIKKNRCSELKNTI